MVKTILKTVFLVLLLLVIWQHQLILYGLSQARGQLKIVMNAEEIETVLNDPGVADSIKNMLQLVPEIKQFTYEYLGFEETDNYQTYFDQGGKPVLWVVTASEPFALKAKEWYFPFLGEVPYKGFFVYGKAEDEQRELKRADWDTNLRVAGGWSTLGWFRDPVLSNMLEQSAGELANTIVHELTHGNLFVKDSVEFNENLASFIGDQGARMFLEHKFGVDSEESGTYEQRQSDRRRFTEHILRGADLLDELYKSQGEDMAQNLRYTPKKKLIDEIISSADTLTLNEKARYMLYLNKSEVNNAFFMSFLRYRADFSVFENQLEKDFEGDLKQYFQHLKQLYPSL